MAVRVREVIADLRSAADGEPSYRELARRLFPVARLFESLGFHTVAREIAHVERSLEAIDTSSRPGEKTSPVHSGPAAAPKAPAVAEPVSSATELEQETDDGIHPHQLDDASP